MERKSNVLIVDDELGPRESLRMILKPYYNIHLASDGKEALEIIYNNDIDLVTLDLRIPGTSGLEILKTIKRYDPRIEVIIITGYGTFKSAVEAIRYGVFDYIAKPFNVLEILLSINKGLERRNLSAFIHEKISSPDNLKELEERWPSIIKEADLQIADNNDSDNGKKSHYLEFLKVLACTLECKDQYTHGHSGRVTYYSNIIAHRIKMADVDRDLLQVAAFLHDIGKLGVSNSLVDKNDRLNESEWTLIREHPEKGASLIENLDVPQEIIDIIRHHHERYDGQGYPYGLSGEDIPLGSRIVALADAYDAMSSDRPYRQSLLRNEIREEIQRCSGTHFDPELVKVFLQILMEEELIQYGPATGYSPALISIGGGTVS